MSTGAQAYARIAQTTASPRDIEAQALLKAARKLQDILSNQNHSETEFDEALLFNRKLWSIFVGDALNDANPESQEIRQNIANIGIFVLTQCAALKVQPDASKLQSMIDINRNIAAGLSGRAA
jgi:flagellar protein FlaF